MVTLTSPPFARILDAERLAPDFGGGFMNLTALKYVLTVAEMLSFTKAAEKLHISQQALSNHVRNIEQKLGVVLFNRGKRITLTYAGVRFVHYATELLRVESQMYTEMERIANQESGILRIAASPARAATFLPEILDAFMAEYPYTKIIATEAHPQFIDDMLDSRQTDIVVGMPPRREHVRQIALHTEMLVALVPKQYTDSLFGQAAMEMRQSLTEDFQPRHFRHMPMIMPSKGIPMRGFCDAYLHKYDVEPLIFYESAGVQTMLSMAFKGLGVAYCIESLIASWKGKLQRSDCPVDVFPICETAGKVSLGAFFLPDMEMNAPAKRFLELLQAHFAALKIAYDAGKMYVRYDAWEQSVFGRRS